ncbi:MAG: exodeoxyribonuclease III [Oscillospiraceae bacterium]
MSLKLISWNVNGLRACANKGFFEFFESADADIFCVQETKMQRNQAEFDFPGMHEYWNSAERRGYSGTAVFAKNMPLRVAYGIGVPEHDTEGRVITLEYEKFYLINVYTPNSQDELARLDYRMDWEDAFRNYLIPLDREKPLIICGDLNVAHREIDLKNPKANVYNAGFTPEERAKFSLLLDSGFVDSFRMLYPDEEGAYTYWSYRFSARSRNAGWRIDYFLVSQRLAPAIRGATIYKEVMGSDHCPVGLEIDI